MRTVATTASAALLAAFHAVAAPRLVADGVLGQSGSRQTPVKFSDCALCVNDAFGNVILTGGWRIPAGGGQPVKSALLKSPGLYIGDGHDIWHWNAGSQWMKRLKSTAEGLVESDEAYHLAGVGTERVFLAPHGLDKGFAGKGRFFVFDRRKRDVLVWVPAANRLESVFPYGSRAESPDKVRTAALHPLTGDLLLAYDWPLSCVRRYSVAGEEFVSATWPARVLAQSLALADGRVFAVGYSARELSDSLGGLNFGVDCANVSGIARGKDGWWLGTTQGAQFYPDVMIGKPGEPAALRVGGLVGVDAIGLSGGRILVCQGHRIQSMWLDDRRYEPLASDRQWMRGFDVSDGRVTSVEGVDGGAFLYSYEQKGKTEVWRFDPRAVWYGERSHRIFRVRDGSRPNRPVNEATVGGYRAVAEDGTLKLFDGSMCIWFRNVGATLLAGEGDRLVAYVPEIAGILRFRLKGAPARGVPSD